MLTIAGGVALGIILVPIILIGAYVALFTGAVAFMDAFLVIDKKIYKK